MTNNRSVLMLLLGAAVMVFAVFGALRLAGSLSGTGDVPTTAMTRGDVEKIIRNYLLENPEVIFEAAERMKVKEQDQRVAEMGEKAKKHADALYREKDPIVAGNPKGDVTIVEFFDYRCPYCRKGKKALADLLKQDGNIRLVLKEYPILSAESELAARAAIASLKQNKYWDFHMALMGADELSVDAIYATAKSVGIDVAKLKTDMADKSVQARLADVRKLGDDIGVDATPTFFIGEHPFTGAMTLDELKAAVATARKPRAT